MRPTVSDRIGHIASAIANIQHILAGQTRDSFANDLVIRLAVEREVISEASRFIPSDQKAREPGINWRGLADIGNWLRHAYHRTDADLDRGRRRSRASEDFCRTAYRGIRSLSLTLHARWSVVAVLGFLSTQTALASDPKPDAAIKNKIIDASVFLDAGIRADPALAADCLAEGRKWIDKNAAEAEASRKQDPVLFRNGGWTFERKYTVRSVVDGHYVSIVRDDYMNSGGAHPNSDIDTILWDKSASKRISIRPFFTETADDGPTLKAMLKGVIVSLNLEKKRDSSETATAEWYKGLEPKLLKIGAVTLAPSTEPGKSSGLTFHYPPYAVGPYVEGQYVAFVPWEVLKSYLAPEGTKIFGGARPKGDDDGTR